MKRIDFLLLLSMSTLVSAQIPPEAENPGSLFPKKYVNPFLDRTAKRAGDIITVIISESSLASFAASTTASKKEENSIAQILGPTLFKRLLPNLGTTGESDTSGQGSTNQTGRLQARMTCTVVEITPTGNMIIEGTRGIRVNKESQLFFLTGVIRPDDIRSDNTVLSESIAEAEIRVDGKGQISDRTRKGILTRLLDWLF